LTTSLTYRKTYKKDIVAIKRGEGKMSEEKKKEIKVIKGGTLIDATGAEPVENAVVVIEGSKITAVGRAEEIEIPEKAKVIDATGKTVMPGLIDSHMHFGGMKTDKFMEEMMIRPPELGLIKSVFDAKDLLEAGFTTVKDCGGSNGIRLRQAIAEGTIRGPRIVAAGPILSQTFGHGDMHMIPVEWVKERRAFSMGGIICDGVEECRRAARQALREGADFIKVCTSGGVLSMSDRPEYTQFTIEEIRAIVEEAHHVGKFVTAHCQGTEAMKNSIKGGIKTIDHAFYPDDEVIEMARRKDIIFVPTLSIMKQIVENGVEAGYPPWGVMKAKEAWEAVIKNIAKLYAAGFTMAVATDFTGSPLLKHGTNAMELELLIKYCGFKSMDALIAATRNGAKACGLEDKIGTIEAGKLADIIIVDGKPLEDIRILQDPQRIKMVIKEGKIEVDRGL
jgi:imidazolonepropionase-like amidohydrolase